VYSAGCVLFGYDNAPKGTKHTIYPVKDYLSPASGFQDIP
jgi:hypothetical protein